MKEDGGERLLEGDTSRSKSGGSERRVEVQVREREAEFHQALEQAQGQGGVCCVFLES